MANRWGKKWKQWQILFWGGSKVIADGDCSHEVKRHLLLGRKWKCKSLSHVLLFATLWLYSPWNPPGQNTEVGSLSLLQHHSSKTSIFWHSTFFMVQLSHLYMTTGKTIDLTIGSFVSKVMALLFNMLSSFVIGEGSGTPLQYSCMENPMYRGAW